MTCTPTQDQKTRSSILLPSPIVDSFTIGLYLSCGDFGKYFLGLNLNLTVIHTNTIIICVKYDKTAFLINPQLTYVSCVMISEEKEHFVKNDSNPVGTK